MIALNSNTTPVDPGQSGFGISLEMQARNPRIGSLPHDRRRRSWLPWTIQLYIQSARLLPLMASIVVPIKITISGEIQSPIVS